MAAETVKKIVWASNMYFFGSKKIAKIDFIWASTFVSFSVAALVILIIVWVV